MIIAYLRAGFLGPIILPLLFSTSCGGEAGDGATADLDSSNMADGTRSDQASSEGIVQQDLGRETIATPPGYFEFCITDVDCEFYGLSCIGTQESQDDGFCSKICTQSLDCPLGLVCKRSGPQTACQVPQYCDRCTSSSQCAPGMKCVKGEDGLSFCSTPCSLKESGTCPTGHICRRSDTSGTAYHCYPQFGACSGDGAHCAPCQTTNDCIVDHVCHENPVSAEKYCAKICKDPGECPTGSGCFELVGEPQMLCTLEVSETPAETCFNGTKQFCVPCLFDFECDSGTCYPAPEGNGQYCTFACNVTKYPETGCPPGLFCVPGAEDTKVCAPPPSWGCAGFLDCQGVQCPMGEKCRGGFCSPK